MLIDTGINHNYLKILQKRFYKATLILYSYSLKIVFYKFCKISGDEKSMSVLRIFLQ